MYVVRRSIEIDAGHRVPHHGSGCRHLHGHRWKIVACVAADHLVPSGDDPAAGMVVDFGVIKQLLMTHIHDRYDHRLILWSNDPLLVREAGDPLPPLDLYLHEKGLFDSIIVVPVIPTAEELAQYWAELLGRPFRERLPRQAYLTAIEVWETPNSCATYWVPPPGGV